MKGMLIDEAYKVLMNAKYGNTVSATVYNDWAANNGMPLFPHPDYIDVNDYDAFYNVCYYYMMGD